MSPAATIFLTELDHHRETPLAGDRLRAYVLAQALFFDRLLVGDSQFNNNRHLRSLVWDGEPSLRVDGAPSDLWVLLRAGILKPAIRSDIASLDELRREHRARKVQFVPPAAYLDYVAGYLGDEKERYELEAVSSLFKHRTLAALHAYPRNRTISRQAMESAITYVQSQPTLLFRSLKDWLDMSVESGRISRRSAHNIDRIASGTYRNNVPLAMRTNLDIPPSQGTDSLPVELVLGNPALLPALRDERRASVRHELPATVVLSREFLRWVPASIIPELHRLKSRRRVVRRLEAHRSGALLDVHAFLGDLEEYLAQVELVAMERMTRAQRDAYGTLKRGVRRRTMVELIIDAGFAAVQLVFPAAGPAAQAVQAAHVAYGATSDLSHGRRQVLRGYMLGRSMETERLLLGVIT